MTGGSCQTMKIELYNKDNKLVAPLDDNNKLLGFYPVEDGMRLHVVDKFQLTNEFGAENVPKFELSEDDYAKRGDTVKTFLMRNKMGKYNEDYLKNKEQQEAQEKALADSIKVGSRCKVTVSNSPTKRGTVMYNGNVDGLQGIWIGIKYDEPVGKHNGT